MAVTTAVGAVEKLFPQGAEKGRRILLYPSWQKS